MSHSQCPSLALLEWGESAECRHRTTCDRNVRGLRRVFILIWWKVHGNVTERKNAQFNLGFGAVPAGPTENPSWQGTACFVQISTTIILPGDTRQISSELPCRTQANHLQREKLPNFNAFPVNLHWHQCSEIFPACSVLLVNSLDIRHVPSQIKALLISNFMQVGMACVGPHTQGMWFKIQKNPSSLISSHTLIYLFIV